MIQLIKKHLLKLIDDIDAGNTNITEEDAIKLLNLTNELGNYNVKLSKYQACQILNCSRATFDNLVSSNILPQGKKEAGFKELFWYKKDILKYIKEQKHVKNNRKTSS